MLSLCFDKTRLLAGFIIPLLIYGCSGLQKLPDNLSTVVELRDTPFFPQEEHQCGPAALATVLNYHQIKVTPSELTSQIFLPGRKGSLQIELAATTRHFGMLAYPLTTETGDLLTEVDAGNPVLVLQNLSFDWLPQWHYAVVVGYNLEQNEVILRSGRHRRWQSKLSTFNNTWKRSGNWALVILPPDEIPQTAKPGLFLKSAFDLEASEKQKEALSAYRAASVQWPDDKRTWLAHANGAFKLNRLDEAHTALKRAILLDPTDTIALNNLAYVFLAAGCAELANQSIQKALHFHPKDKNLQDSKQEVNNRTTLILDKNCKINH